MRVGDHMCEALDSEYKSRVIELRNFVDRVGFRFLCCGNNSDASLCKRYHRAGV
jgi:hypothetical protein